MMNPKIVSMKNSAIRNPAKSAPMAHISRFRSSSRCSRNDILPSAASSSSRSGSSSGESYREVPSLDPGKGTSAMQGGLDLRAVCVPRDRLVERGVRRRRHGGGRSRTGALLIETDLVLERAAQLVRRLLELVDAAAQRATELRKLAWPEDDQRNHEDDDQFGHAERAKHCRAPTVKDGASGWAVCRPTAAVANSRAYCIIGTRSAAGQARRACHVPRNHCWPCGYLLRSRPCPVLAA